MCIRDRPSFATAPALVIVGLYMLTNVTNIDFNDMSEAIPCYVCIIAMPFFYSISEGISMGVITYVALNLITGKAKEKKVSILTVSYTHLDVYKRQEVWSVWYMPTTVPQI